MKIKHLTLVDPELIDLDNDCDTWIESCLHCGTLDNRGNQLCTTCDDLAA